MEATGVKDMLTLIEFYFTDSENMACRHLSCGVIFAWASIITGRKAIVMDC